MLGFIGSNFNLGFVIIDFVICLFRFTSKYIMYFMYFEF